MADTQDDTEFNPLHLTVWVRRGISPSPYK